jgi:hypothetical protein
MDAVQKTPVVWMGAVAPQLSRRRSASVDAHGVDIEALFTSGRPLTVLLLSTLNRSLIVCPLGIVPQERDEQSANVRRVCPDLAPA